MQISIECNCGDLRTGISSRAAIQCIELLECAARWVIGSAHLLGFYLQLQQFPAHSLVV